MFAHIIDKEKLPSSVSRVKYLLLPCGANDSRNLQFICEAVKAESISVFVSAGFILPYFRHLKEATGCKTLFVSHNPPFWETVFKRENGRHKASESAGKWLEWYLLRAWKFSSGLFDRSLSKKYRALYDCVNIFVVLCEKCWRTVAKEIDEGAYRL